MISLNHARWIGLARVCAVHPTFAAIETIAAHPHATFLLTSVYRFRTLVGHETRDG
jgi:hypothetical protein